MTTRAETLLARIARSFGFDPAESRHHFVASIPRGAKQDIQVSEHFTFSDKNGSSMATLGGGEDGQVRVVLARPKWDAIADEVRAAFNVRLKKSGRRPGSWKVGDNLVGRELGKELVLLAWAIEDADPGLISNLAGQLAGPCAEERWVALYADSGGDRPRLARPRQGWRAVRFALTENPVGLRAKDEAVVPEFFRVALQRGYEQKTLFAVDDDKKSSK